MTRKTKIRRSMGSQVSFESVGAGLASAVWNSAEMQIFVWEVVSTITDEIYSRKVWQLISFHYGPLRLKRRKKGLNSKSEEQWKYIIESITGISQPSNCMMIEGFN